MQVLLKADYPSFEIPHECSGSSTLASLKEVLSSAANIDASSYVARAVCFGGDVKEFDGDDETLSDMEVASNSVIMFFAPASVKPERSATKKEQEKEEEKAKKSGGGGFGKYALFNPSNCFQKQAGKKKKDAILALEYIEAEAENLFDSKKNAAFLKLKASQLVTILEADRLNIDEGLLFSAVAEWATHNKKADMKQIYSKIRFPTMDVSSIASLVASSGVVDQKQLLTLFGHTALPMNSRPKKLAGFTAKQCEARNPRFIGTIWNNSGDKVTITEKRTASYSGSGWNGSVTGTPCVKYSVKITKSPSTNFMIGFTDVSSHLIQGNNYGKNTGYYFYTSSGTLYGKSKSNGAYASKASDTGTIVTCEWDRSAKTISFSVNGEPKGVAFSNVADEIIPAIDFNDNNSEVMLCDHP